MPKPKSYPRKLLGHTNFNPPIIYTTETEIEHKWFYRVYISCKCTFSALPGHQYIPSYSLLETRFQKVQKFWLMGRAFWGPESLLRGSLFSDNSIFGAVG